MNDFENTIENDILNIIDDEPLEITPSFTSNSS